MALVEYVLLDDNNHSIGAAACEYQTVPLSLKPPPLTNSILESNRPPINTDVVIGTVNVSDAHNRDIGTIVFGPRNIGITISDDIRTEKKLKPYEYKLQHSLHGAEMLFTPLNGEQMEYFIRKLASALIKYHGNAEVLELKMNNIITEATRNKNAYVMPRQQQRDEGIDDMDFGR
jgi:hypothetical protein